MIVNAGSMLKGRRETPPHLETQYRQQGFWTDKVLTDYLEACIVKQPDRVAVLDERSGSVTYSQLGERATKLALRLYEAGVREGDFFIVQIPNWRSNHVQCTRMLVCHRDSRFVNGLP